MEDRIVPSIRRVNTCCCDGGLEAPLNLRLMIRCASNLALHPNHHIQKQHKLPSPCCCGCEWPIPLQIIRCRARLRAPRVVWWRIVSCHQSAVLILADVMADWKHNQVTTHWFSQCFQSRPTPKSPYPKTINISTSLLLWLRMANSPTTESFLTEYSLWDNRWSTLQNCPDICWIDLDLFFQNLLFSRQNMR